MSKSKKPLAALLKKPSPAPKTVAVWPIFLVLVWLGGSLFLLPNVLDRGLAPRFFWLAAGLLISLFWLRRAILERGDRRLTLLDLLFLAWFGWNLASLGWAFSLAEGLFFAQKTMLAGLVFWFARQMWSMDEAEKSRRFFQKTMAILTVAVLGIGAGQLLFSLSKNHFSLANDGLYEYVSGVFGNKGLHADFLFFLLIFNVFVIDQYRNRAFFWSLVVGLLGMILVLQTRTVYLATGLFAVGYFGFRAWSEPDFRPFFRRRILPIAIAAVAALTFFAISKGKNLTLAERLNPLSYLESASANERRFVWYKTGQMIDDGWVAGVGDGSWKLLFPAKSISGGYRLQEKGIVFTRVHNDFLEIWAELGLIGLGLFVAICLAGLLAGFLKNADFGMRNRQIRWAFGLLGGWLLGFFLIGGEALFERRLVWLFGFLMLAAGIGLYFLKIEKDEKARRDTLVATLGLLGFCLISNFDFPRERLEMQVVFAFLMSILAWRSGGFWAKMPCFSIEKLEKGLFLLVSLGLAVGVWIGWKRVEGETHNVKMIKAQLRKDLPAMAREAREAENFCYKYNDVALPMAWFEGLAEYQMKNLDGAEAAFDRALKLNPFSYQVLNNRASIFVARRREAEALPFFERSLEINPRYDEARFNYSLALFQLGDLQKALEIIQPVDTTDAENHRKKKIWLDQILSKMQPRPSVF